ncbi:hypothetical protein KC953_01735 [Candidatus Saccharibacteria bacterium]|nr:hypothetical protein [Candidatus Saccharibacteria bacterium]
MSNHESSSDTPNPNNFDSEALEYLQLINDAFDTIPGEFENVKAAFFGNLHARKNSIDQVISTMDSTIHDTYKKIYLHGMVAQESNTRLAFEQYIDLLLMLHEAKKHDHARALETAYYGVDESQSTLNERNSGFPHYYDRGIIREEVEAILTLPNPSHAVEQACKLYDRLVSPVARLQAEIEMKNPDSL